LFTVYEDHPTYTKGAILLQKDIFCTNGIIDFDFWMYDNLGSVGIVFRYIDEDNYHLLQFS